MFCDSSQCCNFGYLNSASLVFFLPLPDSIGVVAVEVNGFSLNSMYNNSISGLMRLESIVCNVPVDLCLSELFRFIRRFELESYGIFDQFIDPYDCWVARDVSRFYCFLA